MSLERRVAWQAKTSEHCSSQATRGWHTSTVDLNSRALPSPLFGLYPAAVRAAYIALVREARLLQRHWLKRPPTRVPNVARLLARTLRLRGAPDAAAAADDEEDENNVDQSRERPADLWAGESGTTAPALDVVRASSGNSRRQVRSGAQLPLPSMDYVAFTGDADLEGPESLNAFLRGVLTLSAQPHTRFLGTRELGAYNASHLLCARRGVVTGTKNREGAGRRGLTLRALIVRAPACPRLLHVSCRRVDVSVLRVRLRRAPKPSGGGSEASCSAKVFSAFAPPAGNDHASLARSAFRGVNFSPARA